MLNRSKSYLVQKSWHKTQMRQKRVGSMQSSQFSPLVFIPLWMAYEKKTHLSNPSPKMSYLSKGIICLLSLTNHLMDCILTCRTSDMLLNFTWQFNQFCLILTHKVAKSTYNSDHLKGQLISWGLFGILNFPKKRTKKFNFTTLISQVDLFSFVFWQKLKTSKRNFEINWSLGTAP